MVTFSVRIWIASLILTEICNLRVNRTRNVVS
jgi:hypothetical protein